MRLHMVLVLSLVLLVPAARAASAAPAKPTAPLLLADFESAADLDRWSGISHQLNRTFYSSGAAGMSFDIPAWKDGEEPRPGVVLTFNGGSGFPFEDFSEWGSIAIDVWAVGDAPGKMGLKLRDDAGENSWTTHITVEPGRMNSATLTITDARADCNIRKIREIVLYALRPETAFTLVVDNLRLVPKDSVASLCDFNLRYPNYRAMIFPGESEVAVSAKAALADHNVAPDQVQWSINITAGNVHASKTIQWNEKQRELAVPVEAIPYGDAKIRTALTMRTGGKELAAREWDVRKITPDERDALRVYYDRRNVLHVDGKPFFPIGWYGSADAQQLAEVDEGPFNCMLWYGTNHQPKAKMLQLLDDMQRRDMKLIYCLNDVYPSATYFDGKDWEGVKGNEAIADAVLQAYRDHPAVLAWYLNDELPRELKPDLIKYYDQVRRGDPSRPAFIVLCNRRDLPVFPESTDILGVDPYPIPSESLLRVSGFVEAGRTAVNDAKPLWLVPQAFAWYQYNSKNKDRAHLPTDDELKTGRAPTYEEERCMTWLGLANGATALIYYCYYDFRLLPQYADMWPKMKAIAQEVLDFSPVLLEGEDLPPMQVKTAGVIHSRLLRYNGDWYLIAVNPERKNNDALFQFPLSPPYQGQTMFENPRCIRVQNRRFADSFAPLQTHVYRFGPE